MPNIICDECGASNDSSTNECQLCGAPQNAIVDGSEIDPVEDPVASSDDSGNEVAEGDFVKMKLCISCSMLNPTDAKFCSDCGESLAKAPPAKRRKDGSRINAKKASPAGQRKARPSSKKKVRKPASSQGNTAETPKSAGRQTLILIGGGLLVVLLFFMMSRPNEETTTSTTATQGQVQQQQSSADLKQPLPEQISQEVSALEAQLLSADGEQALNLRRDLARLYAQGGRFDLAANSLEPVTAAANHLHDWIYLGNYSFDWMQRVIAAKDEAQAGVFAKKAIAAYQKALEIEPNDLNVRTDMAVAYLHDPDNPMQAILETNKVLEIDPDHVQANFNRGIMLMQIGRRDQAIEQFERVKTLADHEEPVHQRAEQMLKQISGSL